MARLCPACERSYPDSIAFCGEDGVITIQEQDPQDTDPRLGQRLGDYLLVARIADGAMGRVYEARHFETRERCACKVLHAQVATDQVAVERFKREYEAAEEMDHTGIVRVIDFGTTVDGAHFLTMEYLEGEELGELFRRQKVVPIDRLLRIVCQIAAALDYAHSFGFIHRDLKPDNIFLCDAEAGDEIRILDFGSVKLQMETGPKLTAFGTTLGSPYYMSPEQAMGKPDVDQRSDVFALAAILYEGLTGLVAFDAINVAQILMKIINKHPTPPSEVVPGVPAAIDDVVTRGLAKDKAARNASAGELADSLCAALGLTGGHTQWASKSVQEIGLALEAVDAAAAAAMGTPSERPGAPNSPSPAVPSTPLPPVPSTSMRAAAVGHDSMLPARSNNGLVIGVLVGLLAVGLAVFLFR